jgi:hypothetical protein
LNSAISRFEREIGKAAPGCFFNFCLRMHSAIHLHCSSYFFLVCIVFVYLFLKKLVLHCYVHNIFFSKN